MRPKGIRGSQMNGIRAPKSLFPGSGVMKTASLISTFNNSRQCDSNALRRSDSTRGVVGRVPIGQAGGNLDLAQRR